MVGGVLMIVVVTTMVTMMMATDVAWPLAKAFENFAVAPTIGNLENRRHKAIDRIINAEFPRLNQDAQSVSVLQKD
jgi:hypothetical protein